jgi:exodeoxyribonuclease VII large subunit
VARAIAACPVPVVSAVGHETDFTIADFVADCRAATPSAGAELVAPDVLGLRSEVEGGVAALRYQMRLWLEGRRSILDRLTASRGFDFERRIADLGQELDGLNAGLSDGLVKRANEARRALLSEVWPKLVQGGLGLTRRPADALAAVNGGLTAAGRALVERRRSAWAPWPAKLDALSPLKTLERGYAVCRRPGGQVVRRAETVAVGERVEVVLARGALKCAVTSVVPEGERPAPSGAKEE